MVAWLLMVGCASEGGEDSVAPAPDPGSVLLDLAQTFDEALYVELYFAAGGEAMDAMEDGETLSGTTSFPEEATKGVWDGDGAIVFAWTVAHRVDPVEEYLRFWDWTIDVDVDRLGLASADVVGAARWTVTHEEYDSANQQHAWSGELSVDGADPVSVDWTGWGTWSTLNGMDGTIDGTPVTYENPEPDLP